MIITLIVSLIITATLWQSQYNEHLIFMSGAAWFTAFFPLVAMVHIKGQGMKYKRILTSNTMLAFILGLAFACVFHFLILFMPNFQGDVYVSWVISIIFIGISYCAASYDIKEGDSYGLGIK